MKNVWFYIVLLLSFLLSACGGSATRVVNQPVTTNKPAEVEYEEIEQSSEIDDIISDFERNGDKAATIWSLLDYARLQQSVGQCANTELVVWHIIDEIILDAQLLNAELLRSECLMLSMFLDGSIDDGEVAKIEGWLSNAKDLSSSNDVPSKRLEVALEALSILETPAESSFLTTISMRPTDSALFEIKGELIWRSVTAKSEQQRNEMARNEPRVSSYLAMYDIIADITLDDRARQQKLNTWITTNADNQLLEKIPLEVYTFLQTPLNNSNRIAVLLPLSGRLSAQAEAIKNGIVTAYFSNSSLLQAQPEKIPEIEFIDTGSNSTLKEDVKNLDFLLFSHVIGPLLPSHIAEIEDKIRPGTNTLFLNSPQLDEMHVSASYFSLSPEQEAKQIANRMMRSNIANPILIYASGSRAKRMRDTFIDVWETDNNQTPADVSFSDNKSMRVGITGALGVLQSKQRIQQISNLTTEKVHSVTRNRRDVDAFVVFANAQQVELINPIIESSISLFENENLPVYASSFSYSHKQNKNSLRDLRNMVFMDMPFVQPSGRNSDLAQNIDNVFKQPSTSFLRLFAFGYDAFTLVKNNVQMNVFANIQREGLTGTLSMKNNEIQRNLDVLSINNRFARNNN